MQLVHSPKILRKYFFQFRLGIAVVPIEIKDICLGILFWEEGEGVVSGGGG